YHLIKPLSPASLFPLWPSLTPVVFLATPYECDHHLKNHQPEWAFLHPQVVVINQAQALQHQTAGQHLLLFSASPDPATTITDVHPRHHTSSYIHTQTYTFSRLLILQLSLYERRGVRNYEKEVVLPPTTL